MSEQTNPYLAPDAPIVALMSLTGNPLIKDMSTDELTALLQRVKSLEKQAPTLHAQLTNEATRAGKGNSKSAKLKNILADL